MCSKLLIGFLSLVTMVIPVCASAKDNHAPERQQERMQDREHFSERYEEQQQSHEREGIYGWQLMSPAERQAYRQNIRKLKSHKEREAYRKQHHEKMRKRAAEMGIDIQKLPE